MADIFISYSSKDRQLAAALALDLKAHGFSVWWDFNLVGGAGFRQQILEQLNFARAVIVIWTTNSVRSEFVLDEADHAAARKRLIPLRVNDLDIGSIPLGYRQLQTHLLDDRARLLEALRALSLTPIDAQPTEAAPFQVLCKQLLPLINENHRIFRDFGPNSCLTLNSGEPRNVRFDMRPWYSMRPEIAKNNERIAFLIKEHSFSIPVPEHALFERWLSHIDAFQLHVTDASIDYREHTFPTEIVGVVLANSK
jgi:hypothetical protein